MSLYSEPPPLYPFSHDKPTLLVCWWATIFCTVIILLRVGGRFVRSEQLFLEDRVAALALVPLYLRMACVHVILLYGTNNAQLADSQLSDEKIHRKAIASGLVLLSRVFYAATLWILKDTILEFFARLNISWTKSYSLTLKLMRGILAATFVAVVVSDLAECQPFSHYWQVLPDPGGKCRQGYAQLLTMAVCNILTDLLLVIFPIPIIIRSGLPVKRKLGLVLLFSMSLAVVAMTLYRVPHIFWARGSQRARSLYASVEIVFATAAANMLVLGSFVRDRGVKKRKFKYGSIAAASLERPMESGSRRPTLHRRWGSLEDLVRDTNIGLYSAFDEPGLPTGRRAANVHDDFSHWKSSAYRPPNFSQPPDRLGQGGPPQPQGSNPATAPRKVSFFDLGGLLDAMDESRRSSHVSSSDTLSPQSMPPSAMPASATGVQRGSKVLLHDISGLASPPDRRPPSPEAEESTELQPVHHSSHEISPSPAHPTPTQNPGLELRDVSSLLHD